MDNLKLLVNDLVPVYKTNKGNYVVYGRELHKVLEVKSPYREWYRRRFNDIDAIENIDYEDVEISTPSGQHQLDHIILLDVAKEMAMLERNEKGKGVRKYFINIEKKYKELQTPKLPQTYADALRELADTVEKNELLAIENKQQAEQLEMQKPLVEFVKQVANKGRTLGIGKFAKLLNDNGIETGQKRMFAWLRDEKYLMDDGSNTPYQRYINNGWFVVKMVETHSGFVTNTTRITPKGQIAVAKRFMQSKGIDMGSIDIEEIFEKEINKADEEENWWDVVS